MPTAGREFTCTYREAATPTYNVHLQVAITEMESEIYTFGILGDCNHIKVRKSDPPTGLFDSNKTR